MSQLPTNRTEANTKQEHLDDHNELHRLHDILDGMTPDRGPVFAPNKVVFSRCKIGDPGHIASVNYDGTGFAVADWSVDPDWWTWWFKPSPSGRYVCAMRTNSADVTGTSDDDITKGTLWVYDSWLQTWTMILDKPSNLTNPDASAVVQYGTPNWLDDERIIYFRGPWRTGGANAALAINIAGQHVDVVADFASAVIDTRPFPLHAARNIPIVATGTDTNARAITATTTNGSTALSSSGSGNAFSSGDVGRNILGPGTAPGAYIASVTNSTTAVLSANSGAGAGAGTCLLWPESTTVLSTASIYVGSPMIAAIIGANQEVFSFPLAQTHEDGVGGLPKGFYKFTSNASNGLKDNDPAPDPSGSRVAFLTKMDALSPGHFGISCVRIDDGVSGSGTLPKVLIGISSTERGTADIVDVAANYTSKPEWSPALQANGTSLIVAHRYVSTGNKQSYDTGTPASYVGILGFDYNHRTHAASNARTVWADDHVSHFPIVT